MSRRNERPNASSSSKLQELIDLGIDPFGHRFNRSSTSSELKEQWDQFSKEELHEKKTKATCQCRSSYD